MVEETKGEGLWLGMGAPGKLKPGPVGRDIMWLIIHPARTQDERQVASWWQPWILAVQLG